VLYCVGDSRVDALCPGFVCPTIRGLSPHEEIVDRAYNGVFQEVLCYRGSIFLDARWALIFEDPLCPIPPLVTIIEIFFAVLK